MKWTLLTLAFMNFNDKPILIGESWIVQIVGLKNPGENKPDEELGLREKALRDTRIRNIHEMEELKRAEDNASS